MAKKDVMFLIETHESPERSLPHLQGFSWFSVHRQEMRGNTGRGSGGVACLYKTALSTEITLVKSDEQARFLWIRVRHTLVGTDRDLYIAACYFAPETSTFL